jgi:hypothetical protein
MKKYIEAYLVYNEQFDDWDLCRILAVARQQGCVRTSTHPSGVLACLAPDCARVLFGALDEKMIYFVRIHPETFCAKPESNLEKV